MLVSSKISCRILSALGSLFHAKLLLFFLIVDRRPSTHAPSLHVQSTLQVDPPSQQREMNAEEHGIFYSTKITDAFRVTEVKDKWRNLLKASGLCHEHHCEQMQWRKKKKQKKTSETDSFHLLSQPGQGETNDSYGWEVLAADSAGHVTGEGPKPQN